MVSKMEALVEIRDICKTYNPGENEVKALDHVSPRVCVLCGYQALPFPAPYRKAPSALFYPHPGRSTAVPHSPAPSGWESAAQAKRVVKIMDGKIVEDFYQEI